MTQHDPTDDTLRELGSIAFRVGYGLLGSRHDAEDIAQEAVTRAVVRWRRVHAYPEAFVSRVSTNLAIGVLRKRRDEPPAPAVGDDTQAGTADRLDLVNALRRLSTRQREVIVLRYVADYSERDIARALGCSPGSVKQHCARGLAALRLVVPNVAATSPEGSHDVP